MPGDYSQMLLTNYSVCQLLYIVVIVLNVKGQCTLKKAKKLGKAEWINVEYE